MSCRSASFLGKGDGGGRETAKRLRSPWPHHRKGSRAIKFSVGLAPGLQNEKDGSFRLPLGGRHGKWLPSLECEGGPRRVAPFARSHNTGVQFGLKFASFSTTLNDGIIMNGRRRRSGVLACAAHRGGALGLGVVMVVL